MAAGVLPDRAPACWLRTFGASNDRRAVERPLCDQRSGSFTFGGAANDSATFMLAEFSHPGSSRDSDF